MTLENIYYIGQTVAAAAILITLIFVGAQMRVQNRETRLTAMHELSVEYRNLLDPMVNNPEISRAWVKALRQGSSVLDAHESLMLGAFAQQYLRAFEALMYQYQGGRLDNDMWQALCNQIAEFMATPVFQEYWATRSHIHSRRFQSFIATLPTRAYTAHPSVMAPPSTPESAPQ